jgi:hypothetical protein
MTVINPHSRPDALTDCVFAGLGDTERIYDITYHISSSPYYSEDIHTKITLVLLKAVMKRIKREQILTVKARTKFAIFYLVINNHSHEYKD